MKTKGHVPGASGSWTVTESESVAPRVHRNSFNGPDRTRLLERLSLVPEYDGCPYLFGRFVESVNLAAGGTDDPGAGGLLLALGAKLKGEAGRLFRHKVHRYGSVSELIDSMYLRFAGRADYQAITRELWSLEQADRESVAEYSRRADRVHTLLHNIHRYDSGLAPEEREAAVGAVEAAAALSFERGLRSKELRLYVATWSPKSLRQATDLAIFADTHPNSGYYFRPDFHLGFHSPNRRPGRDFPRLESGSDRSSHGRRRRDSEFPLRFGTSRRRRNLRTNGTRCFQ